MEPLQQQKFPNPYHSTLLPYYREPGKTTGCVICDHLFSLLATTKELHSEPLARLMGVDLRDLSGVTNLMFGMRLQDVIDQWRLYQLCDVLRVTDFPLVECARKVGFRSAETVCRVIQRNFGCTPEEWRQRVRSKCSDRCA